ncbi:MAG: ATP-binding protein [Pseudolysinimonas sp.]
MRRWSLSTRLVAGIVVLLAVLSVAIGAVTIAASRSQQVGRLDGLLIAASQRTSTAVGVGTGFGPGSSIIEILPGQGAGAVGLVIADGEVARSGYIGVTGQAVILSDAEIASLVTVPTDRQPVTVRLDSLGAYRVVATPVTFTDPATKVTTDLVVVNGLSLAEADATTSSLLGIIGGVSLGAIAVAILLGSLVVQLALRPLNRVVDTATRVSELPLESGEVLLRERVPEADTTASTEVGRVGAALNRLLGKVENSLAARHASEQKVRQFVADASHELRTPLASIRGYAELGLREAEHLPPDLARSLARIESESKRMTSLVEDMLLLARLDAGRDLRAETVGLGALLVEAVSDAHVAGPDHRWDLELPPDDLEITGDPDRLRQAVANLLTNARVHTPAGTTVTATLEATPSGAAILVADDGPGIDSQLLPNLFERFSRGDDSRSRVAGSTGLGLAIVAAIIEAHGGTVTATSEPGITVFRIDLPVATG